MLITQTNMPTAECIMCKSEIISHESFIFCVVYLSLHKSFVQSNSSTAELKRAHIAR